NVSLSRGMQGLTIRVAKALNRLMNSSGRVFADHYHARLLETPTELVNAIAYVLGNFAHHHRGARGAFPIGCAPYGSERSIDANSATLNVSARRCGSMPAAPIASRPPGKFFSAFHSVLRRCEKAALTSARKCSSSRTGARGVSRNSSTSAQLSTSGGGVKRWRGTAS